MSDSQIIKPPNTLSKAKVGTGPGKLDPVLLERAEQAVQEMASDYTKWAHEDLANLEAALEKLRSGEVDVEAELRRMFGFAIDMKGQGGSFGYILITAIADSLMKFLEGRTEVNPFDCEVIAAHLAAMRAVFTEEIRNDGGESGQELMDGLFKLKLKAAG